MSCLCGNKDDSSCLDTVDEVSTSTLVEGGCSGAPGAECAVQSGGNSMQLGDVDQPIDVILGSVSQEQGLSTPLTSRRLLSGRNLALVTITTIRLVQAANALTITSSVPFSTLTAPSEVCVETPVGTDPSTLTVCAAHPGNFTLFCEEDLPVSRSASTDNTRICLSMALSAVDAIVGGNDALLFAPMREVEETTSTYEPDPVDCVVSAWGLFSDCDASCGTGSQTRTRTVTQLPAHGGASCPALSETVACNTEDCVVDGDKVTRSGVLLLQISDGSVTASTVPADFRSALRQAIATAAGAGVESSDVVITHIEDYTLDSGSSRRLATATGLRVFYYIQADTSADLDTAFASITADADADTCTLCDTMSTQGYSSVGTIAQAVGPSPSPGPNNDGGDDSNIGMIIGAALGAGVVVGLIVGFVVYKMKKETTVTVIKKQAVFSTQSPGKDSDSLMMDNPIRRTFDRQTSGRQGFTPATSRASR